MTHIPELSPEASQQTSAAIEAISEGTRQKTESLLGKTLRFIATIEAGIDATIQHVGDAINAGVRAFAQALFHGTHQKKTSHDSSTHHQ